MNEATDAQRELLASAAELEDASVDLARLLVLVMDRITEFMEAERSTLFLYDEDERELWSEVVQGNELSEIRLPLDKGIAGYVMRTGESVNIPDAYQDERFDQAFDRKSGFRTRAILCVPLVNNTGKRIGVVQVLNKKNGSEFSARDEALLSALSGQAAIAIENCQLYQNLKRMRSAELELAHTLERQHRELQRAYQKIEENNRELATTIRRARVGRIAGGLFTALLGAIFILYALFHENWTTLQPIPPAGTMTEMESQVIEVSTGPIHTTLALAGRIEPLSVVNLVSPVEGKVKERHFEYGQLVKRGSLLLTIDTAQQEVDLRNAKASYIKARERLQQLENWTKGPEVARAKRNLSRAKSSLDSARRTVDETRRLLEKGIVPATEMEAAEEAWRSLQLDYRSAEEEYQVTLNEGKADNLRVARLELENARFTMEELERRIADARVVAEVDGVVILPGAEAAKGEGAQPRIVERGAPVTQGQALVALANMSGISVSAQVDEVNIGRLAVGQTVSVTGDAFPGLALSGHIIHISSQAARGGEGTVPSFAITVAVPELSDEQRAVVRLGMSANLEVLVYEKEQAVLVPLQAVVTDTEGSWVRRIAADGQTERVKVVPGITTLDSVEILQGVSAGDRLLLGI